MIATIANQAMGMDRRKDTKAKREKGHSAPNLHSGCGH
jgi:hypothetical protein